MVLEIIFVVGVIYYYTNKHRKEKKAKLAAAAAAAANDTTTPPTYPYPPIPSGKGNPEGGSGSSYPPRFHDHERSPPMYEHGQARVVPDKASEAHLPSYAESEVGSDKAAAIVQVNEKGQKAP